MIILRVTAIIGVAILVAFKIYKSSKSLITRTRKDDSLLVSEDVITIKGLQETIRIMQITDAHMSIISKDEKEYHTYSWRMDQAFKSVKHYRTREKSTPSEIFMNLLEHAKNEKVDLLILSGDIINNPSNSSVRFLYDVLEKVAIPYVYIAGNHDWHYEGMAGSDESLRQTWIDHCLHPLYGGSNPLCSSHIVGGINFVAIDNSTYQVNKVQLDFYKTQLNGGFPVVLILHIPMYTESDKNKKNITVCGAPCWGWDMDKNYKLEKRERWPKSGNLSTTVAFLDCVRRSSNLVAVLAGHTHIEQVNSISEKVNQYIAGCSAKGHYRLMKFEQISTISRVDL